MAASAAGWFAANAPGQEVLLPLPKPDPMCPRCGGIGVVPLKDAKPYVWVAGTTPFKPAAAIGEQYCPTCRPVVDLTRWGGEVRMRLETAQAKHAQWQERMGGKLVLVLTRQAALSAQLTATQARAVGIALETWSLQVRSLTDSLALIPTWPDHYGLVYLWEKPAWKRFRELMETLYTPEQLGEEWAPARDYHSYDHWEAPHLYASAQSLRQRAPAYGALFLLAHRQINLATDWQAPPWLLEGFAAYAQHAVLGDVKWFSVYDSSRAPQPGNWKLEARQLATEGKLRPWSELLDRPLRDYERVDYLQTMTLAAFLLEAEPGKFLDFCRRLKARESATDALPVAYKKPLADLELAASQWLLTRK